jgi:pilin isopeptide linkage protein/LPXTG-motif cell wall-anchored protein
MIGPITYTHSGPFRYEISCTSSSNDQYTYDRQVYIADIYIARDLSASVTVIYKGDEKSVIRYTHTYTGSGSPIPVKPEQALEVVKSVQGDPSANSTFKFLLKPTDASNPMPAGSVNGVKTITITGSGSAGFGDWFYTAAGTYHYKVSEENTGESRYTYSAEIYTVTDSVTVQGGRLAVSRVIENSSNSAVSSMLFINKYTKGGSGTTNPPKPPVTVIPTPTPTPTPVDPQNPAGPVTTPTPTPTPGPTGNNENPVNILDEEVPAGKWVYKNGEWVYEEDPQNSVTPVKDPQNGPKTGDNSNVAANIIILCAAITASLGSITYLLTGRKRKEKEVGN